VPHDGLAEVPARLDAGGHKGVTGMQMACICLVLAPVMQSSSSASRPGGSGNVARAARMDHGDAQQGETMGRGKDHFNAGLRPLTASSCNANGSITGLRALTTARTGRDTAESFLPVVVPTRAIPTQAIATHVVVYIAALDVTPTRTSDGGDMRVAASIGLQI
jgi:hypothetical protein